MLVDHGQTELAVAGTGRERGDTRVVRRYRGAMAGKRSDAVQAAHDRLRQRLEGQLRIVQAFVRADEQLTAAQEARKTVEAENQARLQVLVAENQTRVAQADDTIRTLYVESAMDTQP